MLVIYQTQNAVFDWISKHREESWNLRHAVEYFWLTLSCLDIRCWSSEIYGKLVIKIRYPDTVTVTVTIFFMSLRNATGKLWSQLSGKWVTTPFKWCWSNVHMNSFHYYHRWPKQRTVRVPMDLRVDQKKNCFSFNLLSFPLVWMLQVVETTKASVLVLSCDGWRLQYSTWSSSVIKSSIKATHGILVPSKNRWNNWKGQLVF